MKLQVNISFPNEGAEMTHKGAMEILGEAFGYPVEEIPYKDRGKEVINTVRHTLKLELETEKSLEEVKAELEKIRKLGAWKDAKIESVEAIEEGKE